MKPKEKAKELVDIMGKIIHGHFPPNNTSAKSCALICVEEILNQPYTVGRNLDDAFEIKTYWQSVKQEIENL